MTEELNQGLPRNNSSLAVRAGPEPATSRFQFLRPNHSAMLPLELSKRTNRTHQAGWTRWKLISQSLEESQKQGVRESDDRLHPWKMSSLVHQAVAPGQSPRHSQPVPPRICCFQTEMTNRWSSGSSEIYKNNLFQKGTWHSLLAYDSDMMAW